jgi:hypothetical protein
LGLAGAMGMTCPLGGRMRRSASLASSSARFLARSLSPPSASSWIRQAIRLNSHCLFREFVGSPNFS